MEVNDSIVGLKESLTIENCGEVISNIVLTTCVNGKKERVKFLNCKTVNANVEDGNIIYSPPPNSLLDTTLPLNPSPPRSRPYPLKTSTLHSLFPINSPIPDSPPTLSLLFPTCQLPCVNQNVDPSSLVNEPTGVECNSPLVERPSEGVNVFDGGVGSNPEIKLVVDLTPRKEGDGELNVESQPVMALSYDIEESSGSDEYSNSEEEEDFSNLDVDQVNSIWSDNDLSKEEEMWVLAKLIGVSGVGIDDFYIQKIKEMEARDKECRGKKVTQNGC